MSRKALGLGIVCVVGFTMSCGGGGDGVTSPSPPPLPVDVCPNIPGNQATVPEGMIKNSAGECVAAPPSNTRDTITAVLAPADSLDSAPTGVFVDFISSTDSVSASYATWYAGTALSVPKGASGRLCVRGGDQYESRCWNIQAGPGLRFAAALLPNCWLIRLGAFAGENICLTRTQLITAPGSGDVFSFYHRWNNPNVMAPWGVRDDFLPMKIALVENSPAGPWSAAATDSVAFVVNRINQACIIPGSCNPLLVMAEKVMDTVPALGTTTVMRRADNALLNTGTPWDHSNGDIRSGMVALAKDGMPNLAHEIMHSVGFGHTCGWLSRMGSAAACSQMRIPSSGWFSASDIAGFQMAYAIRAQAKRITANLSFF